MQVEKPSPRTYRASHTQAAALILCLAPNACSDDPPPPPAAAFAVSFAAGGMPGMCRVMSHNSNVGTVGPSGTPTTVPAGQNNADITCSIKKSGSNFRLEGNATSNGIALGIAIKDMSVSATKDAPALGTVSYVSPQTQDGFLATDCRFYLLPEGGQFIKPGSTWLTFECPVLLGEMQTCALLTSYAKFENCEVPEE